SEPGAPAMAGGIVGDVDTVREAQLVLQRLGDEPGPADGIAGPMTRGALERFVARCADSRLGPEITRETFIALQAAWAAMGAA
ncbi:MAG: peptidoglycan-binding domain-containing protein, partial [Pseudomonadota bacterium]|nr:peptidoglycan-binding domain-containing protein [Pseudomonadota bacterium]